MPHSEGIRRLHISDGELAQRIASAAVAGAQAEEAELYRRFAPRVRLYGIKHLRDEAAAQDLVQDVLLVTIQRLRAGEIRKPEQIGSFILGTSRVMAGARTRAARRHRNLEEQFPQAHAVEPFATIGLDLPRVERCLHALGDRDRTVLILTFYAEQDSVDIAKALGMTSGVVRVARHRALDRLRECVGVKRAP